MFMYFEIIFALILVCSKHCKITTLSQDNEQLAAINQSTWWRTQAPLSAGQMRKAASSYRR